MGESDDYGSDDGASLDVSGTIQHSSSLGLDLGYTIGNSSDLFVNTKAIRSDFNTSIR